MKRKKQLIADLPPNVSVSKHLNGRGDEAWRVVLGKRFTGSVRRDRHFTGLDQARKWIDEQQKHQSQIQAVSLSPGQLTEAKAAFSRLVGTDMSLTEAVEFALKHGRPDVRRRFDEVVPEFLKSREKKEAKDSTLRNYRSQLKILAEEFGKRLINTITPAKIEEFLDDQEEWSPRTRGNYIVTLKTFLGFAQDRGYCAENSAEKVGRPILDDKPPGILTPSQATALLNCAVERDARMVPGIAIQLFAGLRRSEVCALDWAEIGEELIEVKASISKTRKRRLVTISEALRAWLDSSPAATEVTPSRNVDVYGDRLSKLAEAAKIAPWPHNALRHSFGSYHLAKWQHEGRTALEMGNSPAVVLRHYRELVRPKATEALWNIRPPAQQTDSPISHPARH